MFQQEEQYFIGNFQREQEIKFYRRPDIKPELRLYLATIALYFNEYGKITKLSEEYNVSRNFIYSLKTQLQVYGCIIFGVLSDSKPKQRDVSETNNKISLICEILSLRLEGKCPILGISSILKRRNASCSSVGYISELLSDIGEQLGKSINIASKGTTYAVFASDEVFSSGRPILITVDAQSSAILRMELCEHRGEKEWQNHWQSLLDEGVCPLYLTNDEGKGMLSAKSSVLPETPRQTDTFHAVAHRLGDIRRILEKKAYSLIKEEEDRLRVQENAKSDEVREKKRLLYEQAQERSNRMIDLYEDYTFWYHLAIEQFQIFDEQGKVQDKKEAQTNLDLALYELQILDWKSCGMMSWKKKIESHCKTISNLQEDLFYFLDYAKQTVLPFLQTATIEVKTIFHTLCKAFQAGKNNRKVKSSKAKKYHQMKETEYLVTAQILFEMLYQLTATEAEKPFLSYMNKVYKALGKIIQASSMVETINSIVRSYFNSSKNQINQNQLNLIRFYHNHRVYKDGKRKGFSPMELLSEKKHGDWLELLLQRIQVS